MDLIKLLDIANPKTIKDTINAMIGITNTTNTNASNAVTTANEAKALSQTAATNSASAKQTAEEALAIIEEADTRSEEASLLAEQAMADADDAVDTAELALNTANAARSTVDQALTLEQLGSFVHNTSGIALAHAYMTDNVNQTDDATLDRYHIATPKLVRDALADKMDKINPSGTGSFSLNRRANTTIGDYSFAEGYDTEASGPNSHAEGRYTVASSWYSHAEGYDTESSSYASHAEGRDTLASGEYSHAEGIQTEARGLYSHAEGGGCKAFGDYSHAEGSDTIANRLAQHVFGKFNIIDTQGADANARGKYIEIVGNGTNSDLRSNARTLDWYGNEYLAGKFQADGGFTDGNNNTYTVKLPDTTGWGADKTLATVDIVPIGMIAPFYLTTVPSGWLECNGGTFSSTDYPALYAALGTTTLPDLRNRFIEGANGSGQYKQSVSAGLPNIKGELGPGNERKLISYANSKNKIVNTSGAFSADSNSHCGGNGDQNGYSARQDIHFNAHNYNSIYDDNVSTVQPNSIRMMYCIKAR